MIKDNLKFRHWYRDSRIAIEQRYHSHADLFCDLLAATSPRKHVISNFRLAHRILEEVVTTGTYDHTGMMPVHIGNVDRAIAGEPLSGNKVSRFAMNLKGDLKPVTLDVWMLRYLREARPSLTDKQYLEYEHKCQRNARVYGLEPAEYQAVAWTAIRMRHGYKPVSFESVMNSNQRLMYFVEIE